MGRGDVLLNSKSEITKGGKIPRLVIQSVVNSNVFFPGCRTRVGLSLSVRLEVMVGDKECS